MLPGAGGVDGNCEKGKEWVQYIAACGRHGGRVVLTCLETRLAKNAGQGGGGGLSREELESSLLRDGGVPLLRPGTIVSTDGVHAYRDLDWREAPNPEELLSAHEEEQMLERPTLWRRERYRECLIREAAERRTPKPRSALALCSNGLRVCSRLPLSSLTFVISSRSMYPMHLLSVSRSCLLTCPTQGNPYPMKAGSQVAWGEGLGSILAGGAERKC